MKRLIFSDGFKSLFSVVIIATTLYGAMTLYISDRDNTEASIQQYTIVLDSYPYMISRLKLPVEEYNAALKDVLEDNMLSVNEYRNLRDIYERMENDEEVRTFSTKKQQLLEQYNK